MIDFFRLDWLQVVLFFKRKNVSFAICDFDLLIRQLVIYSNTICFDSSTSLSILLCVSLRLVIVCIWYDSFFFTILPDRATTILQYKPIRSIWLTFKMIEKIERDFEGLQWVNSTFCGHRDREKGSMDELARHFFFSTIINVTMTIETDQKRSSLKRVVNSPFWLWYPRSVALEKYFRIHQSDGWCV